MIFKEEEEAVKYLVERFGTKDQRISVAKFGGSVFNPNEVAEWVESAIRDPETFKQYAGLRGEPEPPEPDAKDISEALRLIAPSRRRLDYLERDMIKNARAKGMAWDDIAQRLGLKSPQVAQQRYRRLGGTL